MFVATTAARITETKMTQGHQDKAAKAAATVVPAMDQSKKSVWVAYIFWLFGGIFGVHHLYLRRDFQAFVWWSTLGGYFGVGWLYDAVYIPAMVREANEDRRFVEEFLQKSEKQRKPSFSVNRFVGACLVSYIYGRVAMMAIPEDLYQGINFRFLNWMIPLFVALGVWAVGNIGREKGKLWHCLLAAYLVYPIRFWIYDETYWFTGMVFCSALAFDIWSKEWRRGPMKRRSKKKRALCLTLAVILYLALLMSYFYFNGKITDEEGDEVPIQEAFQNFLTSPWWTDLKQTLQDTYAYAQHNGWYETWKQIVEQMDMDGEQNAYKVLGVGPTATQTEIKTVWRKLSLENHPDKVKDDALREMAQTKFMEIQQAYEVLSKIKNKRRQRNKKFDDDL